MFKNEQTSELKIKWKRVERRLEIIKRFSFIFKSNEPCTALESSKERASEWVFYCPTDNHLIFFISVWFFHGSEKIVLKLPWCVNNVRADTKKLDSFNIFSNIS